MLARARSHAPLASRKHAPLASSRALCDEGLTDVMMWLMLSACALVSLWADSSKTFICFEQCPNRLRQRHSSHLDPRTQRWGRMREEAETEQRLAVSAVDLARTQTPHHPGDLHGSPLKRFCKTARTARTRMRTLRVRFQEQSGLLRHGLHAAPG